MIVTGFTLVICPLISLMEDQLMVLEQLGISAALLNASSSKVCLSSCVLWCMCWHLLTCECWMDETDLSANAVLATVSAQEGAVIWVKWLSILCSCFSENTTWESAPSVEKIDFLGCLEDVKYLWLMCVVDFYSVSRLGVGDFCPLQPCWAVQAFTCNYLSLTIGWWVVWSRGQEATHSPVGNCFFTVIFLTSRRLWSLTCTWLHWIW